METTRITADEIRPRFIGVLPGTALALAVTGFAVFVAEVERVLLGRAWIDAVVLAILFGMALRTFWKIPAAFQAGIRFCAKTVLEIAVFLLGATLSFQVLQELGWGSVLGIFVVVVVAIIAGFVVSRLIGLSHKLSVLVAFGNAICGNSAIVAAASVIRADPKDVAAAVSFTASFGILVVLLLPLLQLPLGLSESAYGMFAGLTIYAVPQVLAATAPVSLIALKMGTLVKLVRILMLGPALLALGLVFGKEDGAAVKIPLRQLVPWFVVGFLVLMALRSVGAIPVVLLAPISFLAHFFTLIAMAALGLSVDIRLIAKSGPRVLLAACLSLLILAGLAFGLVRFLN